MTTNSIITAVLKLPRSVLALIAFVRALIAKMTANPDFPAPNPPLATMTAATDALESGQRAAGDGTKGAVQQRNALEDTVRNQARMQLAYIQGVAIANPERAAAIIHGAGLSEKKSPSRVHSDFSAEQGPSSGTAKLAARSASPRASYEWQLSQDQKSWTNLPTTLKASTIVTGLTPGQTYYFHYRVLTRAGMSDWSQIVSLLVT